MMVTWVPSFALYYAQKHQPLPCLTPPHPSLSPSPPCPTPFAVLLGAEAAKGNLNLTSHMFGVLTHHAYRVASSIMDSRWIKRPMYAMSFQLLAADDTAFCDVILLANPIFCSISANVECACLFVCYYCQL